MSPPVRGRGLKRNAIIQELKKAVVAPRAGARIETIISERAWHKKGVAPRAGARIETWHYDTGRVGADVAPRAGARIETTYLMAIVSA